MSTPGRAPVEPLTLREARGRLHRHTVSVSGCGGCQNLDDLIAAARADEHSDGCRGACGTNDSDNPPCPAQDAARADAARQPAEPAEPRSRGEGLREPFSPDYTIADLDAAAVASLRAAALDMPGNWSSQRHRRRLLEAAEDVAALALSPVPDEGVSE